MQVMPADHSAAKDRLQREFPGTDWDSIMEAYLDASRLCDAAYDFGDELIRGVLSEAEALKRAKQEHPGFSDTTYAQFLSYGVLMSR